MFPMQEVSQFRSASAECVLENKSREAEQGIGELTTNGKTGAMRCGWVKLRGVAVEVRGVVVGGKGRDKGVWMWEKE